MNNKIFLLLLIISTSVFGGIITGHKPQQKHKNKQNKDKTEQSTAKSEKVKEAKSKTEPGDAKSTKIKETKDLEKAAALVKVDSSKLKLQNTLTLLDSIELSIAKLKVLKRGAHASYYHDRFNGRRTASGKKFDNNGYTAAHKKLPFGTKVKVTNEANGKFVIVEITDRGPFSKAREIDLSRKAFMDLATNKNSGMMLVTIEVIEPPK